MGIFDFLKRNKNIENENGLNETYDDNGYGELGRRYYKKDGKRHGRDENYLLGKLFAVVDYDNGEGVGGEVYHEEGWISKKWKGNVIYLYTSKDNLMTFKDILNKNLSDRIPRQEIRKDIEKSNAMFHSLKDVNQRASSLIINNIEKEIEERINNRIRYEGVVLINDFAFIDDDFPNPINPFTGLQSEINYLEGVKVI